MWNDNSILYYNWDSLFSYWWKYYNSYSWFLYVTAITCKHVCCLILFYIFVVTLCLSFSYFVDATFLKFWVAAWINFLSFLLIICFPLTFCMELFFIYNSLLFSVCMAYEAFCRLWMFYLCAPWWGDVK